MQFGDGTVIDQSLIWPSGIVFNGEAIEINGTVEIPDGGIVIEGETSLDITSSIDGGIVIEGS